MRLTPEERIYWLTWQEFCEQAGMQIINGCRHFEGFDRCEPCRLMARVLWRLALECN